MSDQTKELAPFAHSVQDVMAGYFGYDFIFRLLPDSEKRTWLRIMHNNMLSDAADSRANVSDERRLGVAQYFFDHLRPSEFPLDGLAGSYFETVSYFIYRSAHFDSEYYLDADGPDPYGTRFRVGLDDDRTRRYLLDLATITDLQRQRGFVHGGAHDPAHHYFTNISSPIVPTPAEERLFTAQLQLRERVSPTPPAMRK